MSKDWEKCYSYGMEKEVDAVKHLERLYPLATVRRISHEEDPEMQRRGIDIVVEKGKQKFYVQVKSRQQNKTDFCFEGHWEGDLWVWDWPEATKVLYYLPSFQAEPVIFDTTELAMLFDSEPEKYQETIWKNRHDKKSTAFVPPRDLVKTMRDRNGWTRAHRMDKTIYSCPLPRVNVFLEKTQFRQRGRDRSSRWGYGRFDCRQ